MFRQLCLASLLAVSSCGLDPDEHHYGEGTIVGQLEGMSLATDHGVAIARMFPPMTEIKVSPGGVECEFVQAGDRITFDLGDEQPGSYTLVTGYPPMAGLSRAQARAHVCPAKHGEDEAPCHNMVRSGSVQITRFDQGKGGRIEGSYHVVLADGELSGTFSAYRCD